MLKKSWLTRMSDIALNVRKRSLRCSLWLGIVSKRSAHRFFFTPSICANLRFADRSPICANLRFFQKRQKSCKHILATRQAAQRLYKFIKRSLSVMYIRFTQFYLLFSNFAFENICTLFVTYALFFLEKSMYRLCGIQPCMTHLICARTKYALKKSV